MVHFTGSRLDPYMEAARRAISHPIPLGSCRGGIVDLAQVRQKRGETVAKYIQRFREVKNRCYSTRITEKEAIELASLGLAKPIKDMGFQLEVNSLVHLVQKLTSYEQRHLDIYQDKFKCQITLVDTEDAEDSGEEQEVAIAEL
jgi:hypothetical protein